ncbi:protein BPS1, chloroplastic-like [Tasmannia lanceolata]|uniref:protein BPS1, chloroplastic-like n=1 Tax=Tasmannia lanceolata TaxID=3420 RepID=UPI004063F4F4
MFLAETPRFSSPSLFHPSAKKSRPPAKNLALISQSFDENLIRRLKSLTPGADPPSISLSWLSLAVDLLTSTHADAELIISYLNISASDKSAISYLDESVKVLDICNSISSEIERLKHRRLLIHFILHLLTFSGEDRRSPAPENIRRARDSLNEYRTCSRGGGGGDSSKKRRSLEDSSILIRDLRIGNPPRGKISTVEKLLQHMMYGVGAVTVFIAGIVVSALSGSPAVMEIRVSGEFLWREAFNGLQTAVNGVIGRKGVYADESEALDEGLRKVGDVIARQEAFLVEGEMEKLGDAVKMLETVTEEFSDGLDRLSNGVNGFFRTVLSTRNALLGNFL